MYSPRDSLTITDEDTQFLSPSLSDIEGPDTIITLEKLEKSITDWVTEACYGDGGNFISQDGTK